MASNRINDELSQQEAEERKEYDKLLDNLRSVMKTEQGRHLVWYFMSLCGIYDGGASGEEILRQQGRRDIGLAVIGLMHDAEPTMYAELQLRMARDGRDDDHN